jgi:hypothetical protein
LAYKRLEIWGFFLKKSNSCYARCVLPFRGSAAAAAAAAAVLTIEEHLIYRVSVTAVFI